MQSENLDELYKELGLTDYNIELYTQVLAQLQTTRQELLFKIQQHHADTDPGIT